MILKLTRRPEFWYWLFALLLLPALLVNLGIHHVFVHTDESRRALVALEMLLSDQYIAPTLNGEFYYNKPPLYNWIIALSFKTFGSYSAFALRFPVVLAILAFGLSIWYFVKPIMGKPFTCLLIIATVTSGRILFYDSFLGLIDIAFSVLVFANFMLFYKLGRKGPSLGLFAISYTLAAVAYLMKGLPPLVFQFFTIIAWAVYLKQWKVIFHWTHFVGVMFFLVPVGLYYWQYLQINPQSPELLFGTIFSESSKRTVTEYGWLDTVISIFTFPIENMYHFAPWTILVVCLFRKGTWKAIWKHDFLRFAVLVFGFNIAVYWTSPGVHPRYLFMFLPLFLSVLIFALHHANAGVKLTLERIVLFTMVLAACASVAAYFFADISGISMPELKIGLVSLALTALTWFYLVLPENRWIILGVFLLVLRIGFDWMILPNRDSEGRMFAESAEQIVEIVGSDEIYILSPSYCHDGTSFMISRSRAEILRIVDEPLPDVYYIVYDDIFDESVYTKFLEFHTRGTDKTLYLVKLK